MNNHAARHGQIADKFVVFRAILQYSRISFSLKFTIYFFRKLFSSREAKFHNRIIFSGQAECVSLTKFIFAEKLFRNFEFLA